MNIFNNFFIEDKSKNSKPSYYKYLLFYLTVIFILTVIFYCLGVFEYDHPIPEVRYHFLEKKPDIVYGDDFDLIDLPEKMQPKIKKVNLDIKNVILDEEKIGPSSYVPDVISNLYNGKVPKNIKDLYTSPKNVNYFSKKNIDSFYKVPEFKEDVNLLNISEEPGFSKVENISDSIHKSSFKTKPDIEISSPLKKNISIYDEVMENVSKIKPAKNQIDEFNFTL